jgi:hypothetical protein
LSRLSIGVRGGNEGMRRLTSPRQLQGPLRRKERRPCARPGPGQRRGRPRRRTRRPAPAQTRTWPLEEAVVVGTSSPSLTTTTTTTGSRRRAQRPWRRCFPSPSPSRGRGREGPGAGRRRARRPFAPSLGGRRCWRRRRSKGKRGRSPFRPLSCPRPPRRQPPLRRMDSGAQKRSREGAADGARRCARCLNAFAEA